MPKSVGDGAVLYLHRTRSRDGQAVHIEGMVSALRRQGCDVVMVEPSGVGGAKLSADGGAVARAKQLLPRAVYELLEIGYQFVEFYRLARILRQVRVRAIYQRANLHMLAGVWAARWFKTPLIVEVNAPIAQERGADPGLGWPGLARWSEQFLWRAAGHTLPVTETLAEMVAEAGVPRQRITVVPNGVDEGHFPSPLSREEAKRRLGLEGRMVIGFIGFVRAWHRAERLIDFLASPDGAAPCHVLLVGDGPSKEDLIQYAQQRGVADRFVVTGVVARDEIPAYLAAFDIAVLPDVVPYACPLKLIEYMAAGRAILAPDRPNIREHVAPGISAALFDIEQEGSFQAALARLAHDEGERDRLARSARETFTSRAMLWDDHARSVLRIIADQHTRQG